VNSSIPHVFAGSAYGIISGAVFTLILVYACLSDLRTRRIPNELAAALFLLGLVYSTGASDVGGGLLSGVQGFLVGLLLWLPFWLLGWLGAGDVKLFAGAAVWLGPAGAVEAAGIGALVGAFLALGWLGWERGVRVALGKLLIAMIHPRVLTSPSAATSDRRRLVPYGIALAIGLIVVGWFPLPFQF
jgi:prepilin peptidase CpaA